MKDLGQQLSTTQHAATKISQIFQRRMTDAQKTLTERITNAFSANGHPALSDLAANPQLALSSWEAWRAYTVDTVQRSILFWDTLRQRGDNFVDHTRAGMPPLLHFDYEMVMDGREFPQPVNYALVRIVPPEGVKTDDKQRPYIIIDPRAGHGPGIGGFKDDSQVGVCLHAGHPVYFVIFFPKPEPGQTMPDVTAAEQRFVRRVRELHPDSAKPVIVGNCQGGWAAMMVAASDPEETGPVIINGAPMSYWGGAWTEGSGNNVMRYAGGLLGGSWMSSLTADLGNGLFDGAHLVQNFESLDPANTLWSKYRSLYSKIDTEPPRFLDFERWWGANPLLARKEIEWIVQNLFVGNDLWSGGARTKDGHSLDLRDIRSPVIMFASLGDNITPPQQAFNWIADTYDSTEEIKARGQVFVGLLHNSIGHLGIFVSGKVMNREYTEMVSVVKCIEALPPGIYAMEIKDIPSKDGAPQYEVTFTEHRLEDIAKRLNRFERVDEKPFKAVGAISEFNQRAYELFFQPYVQAFSNEYMADMARIFHPLRMQKWMLSSAFNPFMAWLPDAAEKVREERQPLADDAPLRQAEKAGADVIEILLDYYRDVRDALGEAVFFSLYTTPYAQNLVEERTAPADTYKPVSNPLELSFVKDALASIDKGGYAAAVARTIALLERDGEQLTLHYLELKQELAAEYHALLPDIASDEQRRIRGEQEIICRYAPAKALQSLPRLLRDDEDRQRFLQLLRHIETDPRITQSGRFSEKQRVMLTKLQAAVESAAGKPARTPAAPPPRKTSTSASRLKH